MIKIERRKDFFMLPTDIIKRQEGLLNLIHIYESMDRKVIKKKRQKRP